LPRAAFYVDGFNVYHSIAELKKPYLKWLNHWRLAELVAEAGDEIVKVTFCTAYHPDFRKKVRHERYVKALENTAVTVLRGHYVHEDWDCRECGHEWKKPTEKQGDINVALAIFDDAYQDLFDHAYLVTADSDQAATAKLFKARFPNKRLYSVAPPGRSHSQHILAQTQHRKTITEDMLDLAVFVSVVPGVNGSAAVIRPFEYAPPEGWVHPNDRPA
jgi:hypothetical protein